MSGIDRWYRTLAAVAIGWNAGCASNTAPPGWLPTPEVAGRDAYGGWIELSTRSDTAPIRIEGELIAVSEDTAWVLTVTGAIAVPVSTVLSGKLTGYNAKAGTLGGLTAVGAFSTVSNGALLIVTAPAWLIVGTAAAASQSHAPVQQIPTVGWQQLAAFARFPQGLPPGVSLNQLKPRPPSVR